MPVEEEDEEEEEDDEKKDDDDEEDEKVDLSFFGWNFEVRDMLSLSGSEMWNVRLLVLLLPWLRLLYGCEEDEEEDRSAGVREIESVSNELLLPPVLSEDKDNIIGDEAGIWLVNKPEPWANRNTRRRRRKRIINPNKI